MELFKNVYMPSILDSNEGREHVTDDPDFVLSDKFYEELNKKAVETDVTVSDVLYEYINEAFQRLRNDDDSHGWISDYPVVREQFPALNENVIGSYAELDNHVLNLIDSACCFMF